MQQDEHKQIANFFKNGDYQSALDFLASIEEKAKDDSDFWYYSAHIARKLGDLNRAEIFCKNALEISPDSRDANFEMGIIFQSTGEYKQAISFLKKITENADKSVHWTDMVDTLNSLALTYKKMRDWDNALKYYNLALETLAQEIYENIKRNPLNEAQMSTTTTEGWMRLAVGIVVKNAAKDGITEAMVPDGETATKLLQENPLLGIAFYDEGNKRYILPSYFSAFANALKSSIFFANIVNNLGTLYAEQGDYKQAQECFQEAIEFTPAGVRYDDPHIALRGFDK